MFLLGTALGVEAGLLLVFPKLSGVGEAGAEGGTAGGLQVWTSQPGHVHKTLTVAAQSPLL